MKNKKYCDNILLLINKGDILEAIRYIKAVTGIGLKEAKDHVEELLALKRPLTNADIEKCLGFTPEESTSSQWTLRNIKDVNNIIPYSTLHLDYNMVFFNLLYDNFSDCEIENFIPAKKIFPNAPVYAMPINFLLTKDGKSVAILIVEGGQKFKRYSVLETMELCSENNIVALRFFTTYPNEESYIVNRIRQYLDE